MKYLISALALLFSAFTLSAQFVCNTWIDSPRQNEGEESHSIYRQALKSKDYELAMEHWKIAYGIAPGADGQRDFHLTDGIKLYKHYLKMATDDAKKKEYKENIIRLYEECVACYEQRAIQMNDCDEDCYNQKVGFVLGRMGYDMFYNLNAGYDKNFEVLQRALDINDVGAEYIVFEPLAHIGVYQYKQGKKTAEEMRKLYTDIERIGYYNVENAQEYNEYYESSTKRALNRFSDIETEIFDCAYFKQKLLPKYEEDPTNFETMKYVVVNLKKNGCPEDDPDLTKIIGEYEKLAAEYNAEVQAEYERQNPHVAAKRLYDEGKYKEAVTKYEEAIDKETDPLAKSKYLFSKGSIEGRKLGSLSKARSSLKQAMKLNPDWGRPYMLLGDLYAIQSRKCGDVWQSGLAVLAAIEQYQRGKSVDEEVVAEASSRIVKYQQSKPAQEDAFMQGYKAGDSQSVGCGIGETVRLSFR